MIRAALVGLAALLLVGSAPVGARSGLLGSARLTASPSRTAEGGTVTIRGSGWGLRSAGCEPFVHITAYVIGISPYPTARIGLLTVAKNRTFLKRWVAPKVTDRLAWTVRASQRCGARPSTVRTATITVG